MSAWRNKTQGVGNTGEARRIIQQKTAPQTGPVCKVKFFAALILFLAVSAQALPIREALAQVESGADDRARGRAGEISRFQIMPSVWREYSSIPNYRSEPHAWAVAERILSDRRETFRVWTRRQPTARELYLLWHRPTAFREAAYLEYAMPKRVRERAKRFENLVNKP